MASIERYVLAKRDGPGRLRHVVRYRVRYRDPDGRGHSETFSRSADAERRRTEIEASLVSATWLDPRRGEITLADWACGWLPTRHDLRATTWARLETTMERQVLPRFGSMSLRRITNGEVRQWVRRPPLRVGQSWMPSVNGVLTSSNAAVPTGSAPICR